MSPFSVFINIIRCFFGKWSMWSYTEFSNENYYINDVVYNKIVFASTKAVKKFIWLVKWTIKFLVSSVKNNSFCLGGSTNQLLINFCFVQSKSYPENGYRIKLLPIILTQKMKTIVALTSTHVIYIFGLNHSLKDMFSVVRSVAKHNNTTFFSISSNTLKKKQLIFWSNCSYFLLLCFSPKHNSDPYVYSKIVFLTRNISHFRSWHFTFPTKKTTLMPPAFRAYDLDF